MSGNTLSPTGSPSLRVCHQRAAAPCSGGGSNDQIKVGGATNQADFFREPQLYEGLFDRDKDFNLYPRLAESAEPNATADEWTVRVKDGIEFHNGKTFGAEDLIYSLRLMAKPANFASVPFVAGINLNDLKAVDATTVKLTAGKRATVRVKLPAAAAKPKRHLTVRLAVTATAGAKKTTVKRTLRVTAS